MLQSIQCRLKALNPWETSTGVDALKAIFDTLLAFSQQAN